jgi:hypothetical protein
MAPTIANSIRAKAKITESQSSLIFMAFSPEQIFGPFFGPRKDLVVWFLNGRFEEMVLLVWVRYHLGILSRN